MSRGAAAAPPPPIPNSYWVVPGKLLAGEYPGALDPELARTRLGLFTSCGISSFVNLTAAEELPDYAVLLPSSAHHWRRTIRDHDVPGSAEDLRATLKLIEGELSAGRGVYVHCRAGIGRTGTVIGCLLVERGATGDEALERLNHVWQASARSQSWPYVPETTAQIEYVRRWQAPQSPHLDRGRGALVGLAVGDALAAATQDRAPGSFTPVEDIEGGGPFNLPRGAWSDDTAMALCLADSLIERQGFDAHDQLERYVRWQREGYLSATGQCAGITPATSRVLAASQWRKQAFPGSHDPAQLDPEPLVRVAPAVLSALSRPADAIQRAVDAARVTCQAPGVLQAARLLARMLFTALQGAPKQKVLTPPEIGAADTTRLAAPLQALAEGAYRRKSAARVRPQESVFSVLEAALWAFERTTNFRDGALLAVNLGGRADVVGAVYGQLAGAHYGLAGIPGHWRLGIAQLLRIEQFADKLTRLSGDTRTALR